MIDLNPIPFDASTRESQKIVDYVRWAIKRQREAAWIAQNLAVLHGPPVPEEVRQEAARALGVDIGDSNGR